MALCRNSDSLALLEQMRDDAGARSRLARSWRPMNEKVARVESQGMSLYRIEIERVHWVTGGQALNSRPLAFKNRFQRRIASFLFLDRFRKSKESGSLMTIVIRAAGNECLGKRQCGKLGTAQKLEGPGGIVDFQNFTCAFAGFGIISRAPPQLVILGRELESINQRSFARHRRFIISGLKTAYRFRIFD